MLGQGSIYSLMSSYTQPEMRLVQRRLPWPKRFDVALLSFFGMIIALCDRINMSVAAPNIMQEYAWDTAQMGWALSGFFIGYSFFMIPMGILADKYSPKRLFTWSVAWWSLFTALTPLPRSVLSMTFVRILMGAGESGMIPSMNGILVRWFPRHEYSRAAAFSWSGGYAGAIIAFPLASAVVGLWGWRAVFIAFALLGAVWLPIWLLSIDDDPAASRGVSKAELDYILDGAPQMDTVKTVPWSKILSLSALWGVLSLHFSSNWLSYILMSWLPTYLIRERHFSLTDMAIGSSLPFLSAFLGSNLFGFVIDRLSVGRDRTRVRKLFLLPYAMTPVTLLLLPFASTPSTIVLLLCLSMILMSAVQPVFASGSLDIAPRYAGTVVAIQNSLANGAGVLVPVVTGYVVKLAGWSAAFWLTGLIIIAGILMYLWFGQARRLVD